MENAVDALKIAAAILIFITAIASSFSLFGIAKQTADSIITMRDRQAYLESAELDGGILYTSSSEIQKGEKETTLGVTTKGDRIVGIEDIISTVSRYSKEKYGVTIVEKATKKVLSRYDSNTEQIMSQWSSISKDTLEAEGGYLDQLNNNINTKGYGLDDLELFNLNTLEDLYKISLPGLSATYGIIWGNDEEIQKRIACDFKDGAVFEKKFNVGTPSEIVQTYTGKNLREKLEGRKIVEITNEIDNSKYLKQTDENGDKILDDEGNEIDSNLLQEYTMPTIEVIYIILD